jgi:ParB family transcriptional regulator, chromosome partitioning protein
MRRALGRGLSQLMADDFEVEADPRDVAIESIVPNPRQPRTIFDNEALEELAASIREHGVLQPLVVRPKGDEYELIAGERRLRAAKLAGVKRVPIVIRHATNQDSLEIALIENVQREDIGAMERARAYKRLMDEFEMTQEMVSQKVGKARASVANTVRLLKLPTAIQDGIESGKITEGHAKALLSLETAEQQMAMYEQILQQGMNVREIEQATKPVITKAVIGRAAAARLNDPNMQALEDGLSQHLGSPVKIQKSGAGGKVVIDFYSEDDLTRIVETLGFSL